MNEVTSIVLCVTVLLLEIDDDVARINLPILYSIWEIGQREL